MPDTATLPALGSRVHVVAYGFAFDGTVYVTQESGPYVWVGTQATDNRGALYLWAPYVSEGGGERQSIEVPSGTYGMWFDLQDCTPLPNSIDEIIASPEFAAVEALPTETPEETRLQGQVSTLQGQIRAMTADIETIGAALKENAGRQEWCGEYDRKARRLAEELSSYTRSTFEEYALRARNYDVTVRFDSYTVTVEADSADAAMNIVAGSPFDYIDRHGITVSDDWDVEESDD